MGRTVRFRDVTVDFDSYRLVRDGVVVAVQPQVVDVLRYLFEHRDRVVSKEELLDNIWGDRFVSESTLTSRIKTARQVTGDDGQRQEVIQTVHGRGYRFICPVAHVASREHDTGGHDGTGAGPTARRRLTIAPERLVERDAPLRRLDDALAATADGCQIVVLRGEAGIGKSALIQSFVDRVDDGAHVAVAGCAPLRTPSPLAPFGDLLAQLDGPPDPPFESASDAAERLRRAVDRAGPTIVVIDDLHWADDGTFDAITLVTRATVDRPVLFLLGYRTTDLTPDHSIWAVLASLRALGGSALDVQPLTVAGLQELTGTDIRRAADLWRRTGGNPLFATHVVDGSDDVPGRIQDIVAERLAALPAPSRTAVQLMSMSPVAVELAVATELLGPSVSELSHAERIGLVTVRDGAVAFRHDIVRVAVHDTVPSLERIGHHQRFCRALPSSVPAARRLHHASAGVMSDLVAELGPPAARAAADMGAHRQACELYELVLRPNVELDRRVVAELTEEYAHQLYLMWDLAHAESVGREAARRWRQLGDPRAEGRTLTLVGRVLLSHEPAASLDAARRAVELLEPIGGPELAHALCVLAALHVNESDTAAARVHAQRALDIAERLDDVKGMANALNFLGCAAHLADQGDWEACFRRALDLAMEVGDRETALRIAHNLQLGLWDHGRLHEAEQVAQRTAPIIAGVEHQAGVISHRLAGAHIAFALGRYDEALSLLDWVRSSDHAGAFATEVELHQTRVEMRTGDATARDQLRRRWGALVADDAEQSDHERAGYHRELLGVAVAEMAWATGDRALAAEVADVVVPRLRGRWRTYKSEMLFYLHLAGIRFETEFEPSEPFATAIRGDLASAADAFEAIGRRYQAQNCRGPASTSSSIVADPGGSHATP